MPLYLDVHDRLTGVTAATMRERHQQDLDLQDKHRVRFLDCWANESIGRMFCLVEAPNKEAVYKLHHEAHGLLFTDIYEVFSLQVQSEPGP